MAGIGSHVIVNGGSANDDNGEVTTRGNATSIIRTVANRGNRSCPRGGEIGSGIFHGIEVVASESEKGDRVAITRAGSRSSNPVYSVNTAGNMSISSNVTLPTHERSTHVSP